MDYTVNDVVIWIVILFATYALYRCILGVRDWWRDRIGYDPMEHWRKKW